MLPGGTWNVEKRAMRWLLIALAPVLAGCATNVGPSQAELKAQWEAENVFPQHYKDDLLAFLRTYLNDPTHIRDGAVSPPLRKTVGPGERYVACVRYNSRDSDRKYTGDKIGAAVYVSGKLDQFLDGQQAHDMCKDATWGPFPELAKLHR
jgi:hypothetical protein